MLWSKSQGKRTCTICGPTPSYTYGVVRLEVNPERSDRSTLIGILVDVNQLLVPENGQGIVRCVAKVGADEKVALHHAPGREMGPLFCEGEIPDGAALS